jgi:hypothetical protein
LISNDFKTSTDINEATFRHSLGLKARRGWGWLTNPTRAAYNRVCNRTTRGCVVALAIVARRLLIASAAVDTFMH